MPLLPSPVMLTPSWRTVRIAVRVAGSLVLLAWGLFVVAWLVLHWAILPRIDHWRDDLVEPPHKRWGCRRKSDASVWNLTGGYRRWS